MRRLCNEDVEDDSSSTALLATTTTTAPGSASQDPIMPSKHRGKAAASRNNPSICDTCFRSFPTRAEAEAHERSCTRSVGHSMSEVSQSISQSVSESVSAASKSIPVD